LREEKISIEKVAEIYFLKKILHKIEATEVSGVAAGKEDS